jgi:hypothetical protein
MSTAWRTGPISPLPTILASAGMMRSFDRTRRRAAARWAPMNVERDVRRLWIADEGIPLRWARLSLRQPEPSAGRYRAMDWIIDATLAWYRHYETTEQRVRAYLDTGETLEGSGIITRSDGWGLRLVSSGAWTGVAGW